MVEIVNQLKKPATYIPVVAGATAGIIGMQYVIDQSKVWVAQMAPGNDLADTAVKAGLTVGAVAVYLMFARGTTNMWNQALQSAGVAASGVAGFSLIAKLLAWNPMTIGRIGATVPTRPVTIVRKETTPVYRTGPTATPLYHSSPGEVPSF